MPSGKTHDKITWYTVPAVGLLAWLVTQDLLLTGLTVSAFLFAGLMFSGDLDTKSVQYKRWGPMRWIWIPYQKMVPHRSAFSHGPVLGVMARLCYLTIVIALLFAGSTRLALWLEQKIVAQQAFALVHQFSEILVNHPLHLLLVVLGLWLGGLSHTLADEMVSAWKKRKRRKRKQQRRLQKS